MIIPDKKNITCCFKGPCILPAAALPLIAGRTEDRIRELIEQGVKFFGIGGATGYDTVVTEILFRLRDEFPHIKVALVYPYDGFNSHWAKEQKDKFEANLKRFNKVVKMSDHRNSSAFHNCDEHLVRLSGHLICYLNESDNNEIATTVAVARSLCLKIYNTFKQSDL